jgi:mRNA-degrading endonuclease RelE of RelBE toxin-antitoxin system
MAPYQIDTESAEKEKKTLSDPQAQKKWPKYEATVSENPFHHPKHKRIEKLKGTAFPPGSYRYSDNPLRVVYYPNKETETVYTLSAGTATDIAYKKRSKK